MTNTLTTQHLTPTDATALAKDLIASVDDGGIDLADAVIIALCADGASAEVLGHINAITALVYEARK